MTSRVWILLRAWFMSIQCFVHYVGSSLCNVTSWIFSLQSLYFPSNTGTLNVPSVQDSEADHISPYLGELWNSMKHARCSELEYPPSNNAHFLVRFFCFYIKFPFPHLSFCKVCKIQDSVLYNNKLHFLKKFLNALHKTLAHQKCQSLLVDEIALQSDTTLHILLLLSQGLASYNTVLNSW